MASRAQQATGPSRCTMPARPALSLLSFWAVISSALAQDVEGNIWKVPAPAASSNLSQVYLMGQTVSLSWNAFQDTRQDLWLTTSSYETSPFSSLLYHNISVATAAIYRWTVTVPAEQLAEADKYVLRFRPTSASGQWQDEWGRESDARTSSAFVVLPVASPLVPPGSSSSSSQPDVFPIGDKLGIAAGVIALVALVLLFTWLIWRQYGEERHRRRLSHVRDILSRRKTSGGLDQKKSRRTKSPPNLAEAGEIKETYANGRLPGVHELQGSEPPSATVPDWPIELPTGREPLPSPPRRSYHF